MQGLRLGLTRMAQAAFAGTGRRLCPRRGVFLHLPKTAGTTVTGYFKARLGASWYGQAVTVSDAALERPHLMALARGARYVGGHFGAGTLAAIRDGAYAFTVLRDPVARVESAWRFFQSHRRAALRLPFDRLEDALASDHPGAVAAFDNAMVRQLSGAGPGPLPGGAAGAALVDRAEATLAGLDRVLWQDDLEAGFAAVLADLALPPPAAGGRRNVTDDPLRPGRARERALPPVPERAGLEAAVAPRIALDRALVDRWRARAAGAAGAVCRGA